MIAFKCDRCKKYFENGKDKDNTITYDIHEAKKDRLIDRRVDLCPSCQLEMRHFLEKSVFTATEVENEIRLYGQHDPRFKSDGKIKYSPGEIGQILKHGMVFYPDETPSESTSTADM